MDLKSRKKHESRTHQILSDLVVLALVASEVPEGNFLGVQASLAKSRQV